ncbi:HAD family phosphatase [Schumannella luteola]|uniref:Putative hydrolase of the HAD superfamily n=1 Tax=Schumannella luteola TaxID=472059 RepID=A0A852YN46_9MICO|nr:HAD-IA family hydrolase [Schumannella luteola]NYH00589.1 putative hydrolase of the HAD superfamily [Schumannella luteola]TPX04951.1 HAD-IA family hydrolase [Schumannella luteola]
MSDAANRPTTAPSSADAAELPAVPVRWLLFDVGGVIEVVDDAVWPGRLRERWAARLGLEPEEFSQRLAEADLPDVATTSGQAEAYWSGMGAALGASPEQLAELRADFWNEYCGTADEPLLEFLRTLHGRVGLAILSNSGDGAREEEERRFGFASLFDPILYSHEIGVNKPDPEAFRIALRELGAEPGEVLFVDNWTDNVSAARELGLRAHLHADGQAGTPATIAAIEAALSGA